MGLVTTHFIRKAHWRNECQNFIVYGGLGYGKTSYAMQVLMEVYETEDINILKNYYAHTPVEVLTMLRGFKKQVPAIVWDDAGVWLYYMDFGNPMVKHFGKMLQMIRTKVASIVFTTPNPTLILGKLRNFPQTLTLKVKKPSGDPYNEHLRSVIAYRSWLLPDLQKFRIKKVYEDDFNIMLPQEIYSELTRLRSGYVEKLEKQIEENMPKQMKEEIANRVIV
jgi:hypothetical protein